MNNHLSYTPDHKVMNSRDLNRRYMDSLDMNSYEIKSSSGESEVYSEEMTSTASTASPSLYMGKQNSAPAGQPGMYIREQKILKQVLRR